MRSIDYPPRLSLARLPTPFQPLDRLSEQLGGPRIWVKRDDLTDCALSGNKIRKLEFTLARALEQGCDTLVTCGGVQSNHCRATAILGAQLGLKVHLILRNEGRNEERREGVTNDIPDGNLFLDYLCGAQVSLYEKKKFQHDLPELFDHWCKYYQASGRKPYTIPTGASDGTGVWGYVHCVPELIADFDKTGINPRTIFHATGSGGTQAGLTAGAALYQLAVNIIGIAVCDNEQYFQNKVRADIEQWQSLYGVELEPSSITIQVDDRYVGPGYAQATAEVFDTIRHLASLEGVIFDPIYTGKAFHGMIDKIRRGELDGQSDIVFIHTGGIFGLLSQRDFLSI
ncbi:MAG: D-cysteine desulfhydrase family protein [Gammaproteobacteria bacterium]|nr:MAG: D-cysteine desulfhydrase family protein [Gammaproteobacteria bacterium]RLA54947.1 MAG: D-cysteine desulfhydrase family protein [Gammaproteobacteria bacterium]